MSIILSAIGSSHRIEQVITEAKNHIVIVTPYLKITNPLLSRLIQADKNGIKIILIYGKNEIQKEQKDKLNELKNLNLYFLRDLHAKCYLNEFSGVLSSMNLYEYSQVNNWELGISFDVYDTIIMNELLKEIELMIDSAQLEIQNFQRFNLIKKSFLESLAEFLNDHFKTDKFIYERFIEEFIHDYIEEVKTKDFPNQKVNIEIFDDATRVDFVFNLNKSEYHNLDSKLNIDSLNDEFRIYRNSRDILSMYNSVYHRDKWDSYSDEFKFKHWAEGIEKMMSILNNSLI